MKTGHYLFLIVLMSSFFGFNFFVYTTSFDSPSDNMEATAVLPAIEKIESKKYPLVLNFGDAMFDRGVRNIMENRGRDPFEYIKNDLKLIREYDVIIANLEGPIVEMNRDECQQKAYNFQFAGVTTEVLKSIGINMVNIANNHSYDCYKTGFDSTKKYLSESGISYMGDLPVEQSYVIKTIQNKKITFVGMDETIQRASIQSYYALIKKLKAENDYVVVNIHWGTEYSLTQNMTQSEIARHLIDNGADVIFGHHPHVVQPVEVYKGGVVFYSLGNFVFDQNFGDTMVGLGAGVELRNSGMVFKLYPFNLILFAPEFMKGEEKVAFCNKFLSHIPHSGCEFTL